MSASVPDVVAVADLVAAVRRQQLPRPTPAVTRPASARHRVCVLGAHRGAGATGVAVALVDTCDAPGRLTTLLDLAPSPDSFAAAECEVDSALPGWRAGRRGQARVLRRCTPAAALPDLPGDLIVDGDLESIDGRLRVCRATVPSTRCGEAVVSEHDVVAVVGATRWPRAVAASLGPHLRRATDQGRVVFVPHDRGLELYGVDTDRLPASTRAAARRLRDVLWPDLRAASTPRRPMGGRR